MYVVKTRPFCKKGLVTVTYNTYNILLPYYQLYVFVLSIRIIHYDYTRDGQIWYTRGNTVYTQLPRAVNRGISVSTNKLDALFHNLLLLFRVKKPNYTEPMVGWNEEDKKTGLVKFGVTHISRRARS
mgnify:CR=1 FL=1